MPGTDGRWTRELRSSPPGPVRLRRSRRGAVDRTYERIPHASGTPAYGSIGLRLAQALAIAWHLSPSCGLWAEALPDLGCSSDLMDPTARKEPGQATDRDSSCAIRLVPGSFLTRHRRTARTFRPSRPQPLPCAEAGPKSRPQHWPFRKKENCAALPGSRAAREL